MSDPSLAPSWIEHADLFQWALKALALLALWLIVRAVKKIDDNQDLLFTRLTGIEKDFYEMRGEHKANQAILNRRKGDSGDR